MINQNIFSDVRMSWVRGFFPLTRRGPGSSEPDAVTSAESATWNHSIGDYVVRPSRPTSEFFDERDTDSLNATLSWYITGENTSHDVKFGGNHQWINYFAPFNYPFGYRRYVRSNRDPAGNPNYINPIDGSVIVPVEVRLYNAPIAEEDGGAQDCFVLASCWAPDNAFNQQGRAMGLFLQDTLTIANRVTIAAAPDEGWRERYLAAFRNWRFMLACASIGCQNAARYGLLIWVPVHYLGEGWKAGPQVWIPEGARIEGRSARSLRLMYRQGVTLLGVSRQGKQFSQRVQELEIKAGDILLLLGSSEQLADIANWLGCLPGDRVGRRMRADASRDRCIPSSFGGRTARRGAARRVARLPRQGRKRRWPQSVWWRRG